MHAYAIYKCDLKYNRPLLKTTADKFVNYLCSIDQPINMLTAKEDLD